MMTFTRDSKVWTILYTIGLAMAGGLIAGNAVDYGMTPVQFKWAQLVATGLIALGKLSTSPLPHSTEGDAKVTTSGE